MEQRISENDERRMLRAIDKAEMIAGADDTLERSKVVADSLMAEHVDKRFAKTAAAAFNKRLTVNTLSRTPDSEKPSPFTISDPEMVYQLMGGEAGQTKKASVSSPAVKFLIEEDRITGNGGMKKAASITRRKSIENPMTVEKFETGLMSCLQKAAACVSDVAHDVNSAEDKLEKAVKAFDKEASCASYADLAVVSSLYGKELQDITDAELPHIGARLVKIGSRLEKCASAVIEAKRELAGARADKARCGALSNALIKVAEEYEKQKKTSPELFKSAAMLPIMSAASQLGTLALALPGEAMNAGLEIGNNLSSTYNDLYNLAERKYDAGRQLDNSPGKVLTAEFINRDRYGDRLMNISDMLADKSLQAIAPRTKDIMDAANKAMDTDMTLERRDRSEVLRAAVSDLLLQNNRQNMASINALTGVSKNLSSNDKNTLSGRAAETTGKLTSSTPPALVQSEAIRLPSFYKPSEDFKTTLKDLAQYRNEKGKTEAENKSTERELLSNLLVERYGDTVHMLPDGRVTVNGKLISEGELNLLKLEARNLRETFGSSAKDIAKGNADTAKNESKNREKELASVKELTLKQLGNEVGQYASVRTTRGGGLEFLDATGGVLQTFDRKDIETRASSIRDAIRAFGKGVASDNIDNTAKGLADIARQKETAEANIDKLTDLRLLENLPGGRVVRIPGAGAVVYDTNGNISRALSQARLDSERAYAESRINSVGYDVASATESEYQKSKRYADKQQADKDKADRKEQQDKAQRIANQSQGKDKYSEEIKRNLVDAAFGAGTVNDADLPRVKVLARNGELVVIPPDNTIERIKELLNPNAPSNRQLSPKVIFISKDLQKLNL